MHRPSFGRGQRKRKGARHGSKDRIGVIATFAKAAEAVRSNIKGNPILTDS